jgi:hypothetical protein
VQSDILAPWKERIKREVAMIDDVVLASTGTRLEAKCHTVLAHQLERLVQDVVVLTIQEEEAKKG